MQPATEPAAGFRLPLATSIFLLFAVLLGLAIGAAIVVTNIQGTKIASQAVGAALQNSSAVQSEFAQRRKEEAELKVQLIAADASFVKYVSDAQGSGLGLGEDPAAVASLDTTSITDLLRERQESFGFDVGIVLDPQGKVLARSDQTEAFEESMQGDRFVESGLKEATPISGYWRQGDRLYQAALWPLAQDQDLVGFLLVALTVDHELGARVGRASGAEIAFLLPSEQRITIAGASLETEGAAALQGALDANQDGLAQAVREGKPVGRVNLEFAGQRWIGELAPLDAEGGSVLGSTLRFTSADLAAAGYRRILNLVGLAGLIALLVALPLSFLLAKLTLRPLNAMAQAASDAAAGQYNTRIHISGKDELATLCISFNRLLSDLREKSDIEGYVTNLSRFLPDPGQEREVPSFVTRDLASGAMASAPSLPPPAPAQREQLLLFGVDQRAFAKLDEASADDALTQVSQRTHALLRSAARHGGKPIASSGARSVFGFAGDERLARALNVARDLMLADSSVAAALIEGEVVHGTISAEGQPPTAAAVGPASFQLDRLLGESAPGRVLLPRTLGEQARDALAPATVPVMQGAISQKPFYGLDAAALSRVPNLPAVPGMATGDHLVSSSITRSQFATSTDYTTPRGLNLTELRPGQRLGGRYEVLSVLGSGGMGVVYKARDLELDDVVALKMLKPSALVDNEHLERLKSEIKLARRITHPNVLRTFDFGEVGGRPYISMEYVRGMTLRYLLKQAGRIPYSAALRIARQLCAGLGAAHEVGVLHRDIKPENLILEASGNAKLMDFGIARPIRRSEPGQTQPGMFVGTPAYSAPEQLAGEEVDHRADIYSSGVLLCEIFSGKLPFTGSNTMEIYIAQMQQEPIRPSAYWPEMPAPLEQVILRCIAREMDARYQSAAELSQALAELRA
jgi:eukaryotic-like serine/threonine-protein kinase